MESNLELTQKHFDEITQGFNESESQEISKDERLLSFGEVETLITPLVYGEILHSSIAEFIFDLQS
jgi:hypothetical protein